MTQETPRVPRLVTTREGLREVRSGAILLSQSPHLQYVDTVWRIRNELLERVGKESRGVTPLKWFVDPLPVLVIHEP